MIYAKDINEQTPWQKLTPGGEIYEPATSLAFQTGDWRTQTPKTIWEKCKQCLLCVPYCPDSAIPVKDGKREEIDLVHCKGCGICITACPFDAIVWKEEA